MPIEVFYAGTPAMSPDSIFVIRWMRRMMNATGICGSAAGESLFYASGAPEGDDATPESVELARQWEREPERMFDYIRGSGQWCMSPSVGCQIAHCKHMKLESQDAGD